MDRINRIASHLAPAGTPEVSCSRSEGAPSGRGRSVATDQKEFCAGGPTPAALNTLQGTAGGPSLQSQPTVASGFKVAVLGAAGGIGQPLSLLMKL